MQEVYEFLKKCGTYYLGTVDATSPVCARSVRSTCLTAG